MRQLTRSRGEASGFSTALAVAGAVGCGRLTAGALRGLAPSSRLSVLAVSLVPVALVYPLARTAAPDRRAILREVGGVSVMALLATRALRGERIHRAAAWGWLAHAAFDVVHEPGDGSLLPDWYPAVCAGFDVGVAWDLLAHP